MLEAGTPHPSILLIVAFYPKYILYSITIHCIQPPSVFSVQYSKCTTSLRHTVPCTKLSVLYVK